MTRFEAWYTPLDFPKVYAEFASTWYLESIHKTQAGAEGLLIPDVA